MSVKTIKHPGESGWGHGEPRGSKTGLARRQPPVSDGRRRLAKLAEAQDVPIVRNVADLAVDFWPEDESADDINSYIYRQRREDRMGA